MERSPRSRFYDGRLYARVMDPILAGLHGYVAKDVPPGAKVIDIGCGTGSVAFRLADTAEEVVGVELSPAMVAHANRRREREQRENVEFRLGDASAILGDYPDRSFDVATLVMVLHEMPRAARHRVLHEAARVAQEVLCLDFRVPMPWKLAGIRNRFFELVAGREHFRAYLDYARNGGLGGIVEAAGVEGEHVRFLDGASLEVQRVRTQG